MVEAVVFDAYGTLFDEDGRHVGLVDTAEVTPPGRLRILSPEEMRGWRFAALRTEAPEVQGGGGEGAEARGGDIARRA